MDEDILCERDLFKLVGDLSWEWGRLVLIHGGRVILGATWLAFFEPNRNYSAILATLQITSYALGV